MWGFMTVALTNMVSYLLPKERKKGITKINGSSNNVYDVTWEIIDGEKIGVKCTCKGFAFRNKCKHLEMIK